VGSWEGPPVKQRPGIQRDISIAILSYQHKLIQPSYPFGFNKYTQQIVNRAVSNENSAVFPFLSKEKMPCSQKACMAFFK